jgi:putative ABC transport system permease protein
MIRNFIKTALNNMLRNKTYTAINIFGLSIGLACVMLITLYVRDEFSFDRFNKNGTDIYRLVENGRMPDGTNFKQSFTGDVQGYVFQQEIPGIKEMCRVNGGGESLVRKGRDLISESMFYADKNVFKIFTFPLVSGNPSTALNNPDNVVITTAIAEKYFGTNDCIGKVIQINQDGKFVPFTVTAVAKVPPHNSTIRFSFLLPIERTLPKFIDNNGWFSSYLTCFFLIDPHANIQAINQKMALVYNRHAGKAMADLKKKYGNFSTEFLLEPFFDVHLSKDYGTGNGLTQSNKVDYSYILGGIALFILFIACINFINLSLSRALRRSKEIGIRKVIGSSRGQLVIQFLGESLLLTLLASFIAVLIVVTCLPGFNKLAQKDLQLSYLYNPQVIAVFVGILVVNTFLTGFYPALVQSGFKPVQTLYGKMKISGNNYFGKSLVVMQFVIAIFLVIGTVVMQKQFSYLVNYKIGYEPKDIVDLSLPQDKNPDFTLLKNDLLKFPFIKQVAGQSWSFTSVYATSFTVNNKDMGSVNYFNVDNAFLSQLHIPVIAGHSFRGEYGDTSECLVNQVFIKKAGWNDNPIGKVIHQDKHVLTVIGVTPDFHNTALNQPISPVVLRQTAKADYGEALIKIDPSQKEKALDAIQKEYKKIVPEYPCSYNFLTDMLADQYADVNQWKQMVTISSIVAIIVSCLGLFGLATLSIEQRVREIGVRKVLGASVTDISTLLTINFIKLVLISIVIASPLAWYAMNKWLQTFSYKIDMDIWVIFIAGAGSIFIAAATISFQAIKAAIANPVKSLRSE